MQRFAAPTAAPVVALLHHPARHRALVEFVRRVDEISRGKAYVTNTMTLGQFMLMDFLRRKTKRVW
jgi:uncharacterized protein with von Willebrand factor type A (vWA) domain